MTNYFKQLHTSKGYTLLFSVLVSSLVLAIAISILNISKKEFLIATSTRDSSSALYAADAGIECAIYSESAFDTTNDTTSEFNCNLPHSAITRTIDNSSIKDPKPGTFEFAIKSGTAGNSCANVKVIKEWVPVEGVDKLRTTIDARGYNIGWRYTSPTNTDVGTCDLASAKRVERGLRYSAF